MQSTQKIRDGIVTVALQTSVACGMTFGWSKCATVRMQGQAKSKALTVHKDLPTYNASESYKYIGFEQVTTVDSAEVYQRVQKEFLSRVEKLCSLETTIVQFRKIYNTACVGYLRYYIQMGVASKTQGMQLEARVRNNMCTQHIWNRNQAVCRMYLPASEGGLGLKSLETVIKTTVANVSRYLMTSNDPHVRATLQIYKANRDLDRYQNCLSRGFMWNGSISDRDEGTLPTRRTIERDTREGKRELGKKTDPWEVLETREMCDGQ